MTIRYGRLPWEPIDKDDDKAQLAQDIRDAVADGVADGASEDMAAHLAAAGHHVHYGFTPPGPSRWMSGVCYGGNDDCFLWNKADQGGKRWLTTTSAGSNCSAAATAGTSTSTG